MTAYQKLSTLSEPEIFEAWLMRIAVNRCKMQFRSQNAEDYLTFKQSHKSYTSFSWADSFREGTPKDLFELLQPLDDIAKFVKSL